MPLDENDLAAIAKLLDTKTANFITADQAGKLVGERVESALNNAVSGLETKLLGAIGGDAGDGQQGGNSGGQQGGGDEELPASVREALARQKAENDSVRQELQKSEDERKAALERERNARMLSSVRHELTAAGIPSDRLEHAVAFLQMKRNSRGEPILSFDDAGQPVWADVHSAGFAENLSIKEGIGRFVGGEGKIYLPPVEANGAGHRRTHVTTKPPRDGDGNLDTEAMREKLFDGLGNGSVTIVQG